MLYNDSDDIKTDGISVDELDDDQVVDQALNQENINGLDIEGDDPGSQPEDKEETSEEEESTEEKESEKESDEETSEEESDDEKEEEGTQPPPKKEKVEEKELPFHKHPRWQKLVGELQELRTFKEETVASQAKEKEETKEKPPMPSWFIELYGENQEGWDSYLAQREAEREQDRKAILAEIEAKEKQAKEEVAKMDEWVDEQVQVLKDDPDIGEFDRNRLLKVMLDYKPTDEDGNLDFYKGYKILEMQPVKKSSGETPDKTKTKIKKSVAPIKKTKTKSEAPTVVSSQDVRHKSFSQLAEE